MASRAGSLALRLLAILGLVLTPVCPAAGTSAARPGITDLEVVPAEPRLGDSIELRFALRGFDGNPYDPDEIRIDARWRRPGGTVALQPAFWYQPFHLEGQDTRPDGLADWRVRLTPRQAGRHELVLEGWGPGGALREAAVSVEVAPGRVPRFVGVSERNPRYLAFSDGSPFWGLGMNVGWWQFDDSAAGFYEPFFHHLSAAGGNLVRLWMTNSGTRASWILSIQDRVLGAEFNQRESWLLDRIVDQAEREGIRLLVTLEDVNELGRNWEDNLYNRALGGPLERPSHYFTNPQALRYQKGVLRYVVARWGYSPSVFAWELFNEIDLLERSDRSLTRGELRRWHRDMARYLREIDPHRHLVGTSTKSFAIHPRLYGQEVGLDWASMHLYDVEGRYGDRRDMAQLTHYFAARLLDSVAGKPALVGEVGIVDRNFQPHPAIGADPEQTRDRDGVFLHNALWAGVMSGLAVAPLPWHWLEHQQFGDAWWRRYRGLSLFLNRIDPVGLAPIAALNLGPVPGQRPRRPGKGEIAASDSRLGLLGLRDGAERVYLWVQNRHHTWGRVVDGTVPSPLAGRIAIGGLAPMSSYSVRWWDPWTLDWVKQVEAAANGEGRLELLVEGLIRDRAVAIEVLALPVEAPRAGTSPSGTGRRTRD